jgi:NADH:ubiquinone oxidoreductase subunit 6 (subunit J)
VRQILPNSEQAFRSFDTWNFGVLRQTLAAIGGLIASAPLFHSMMWLVTAAGLAAFFHLPRKASEARWLAVVCATVWLGYNVFLLIVYVGAMRLYDAEIAADYWRYTPHAALLGLYTPAMALAIGRWPAWMNLRSRIATIAVVLLAVCAMPVRSDINNPRGRAWQRFLREAAAEIQHAIPPGSNLLIVPVWDGSPFAVAVRYHLWQLGVPERQIFATVLWDTDDFAKAATWEVHGEANYLLVQDAGGAMDQVTDLLGLPRINNELALFGRQDGAWQKMKSWPVLPNLDGS